MDITILMGTAFLVVVAKSLPSTVWKDSSASYVNVKGHILLLVIPVNLCENHDVVEACLVLQMCVLPVLAFWC